MINILLSFLPIIIMLIVFVLVFKGIRLVSLRIKIWTPKRIYVFVGIYLVVGIVLMLALPYLPNAKKQVLSEQEIQNKLDEAEHLEQLVQQKRFAEIDASYLKKEWTMKLPTDELTLTTNLERPATQVVVTWRDDPNSNDIFANYYEFPFIFSGIDITDKIVAPEMTLDGSNLSIVEKREVKVTYHRIQPNIETLENYSNEKKYHSYLMGQQMLHLNVPKHINIIDNSGMINYLYYE